MCQNIIFARSSYAGGNYILSLDQINGAISLNHTRRQWVYLGILTTACIARPETCDAAGGAVAFWMRIDYNDDQYRGIISSGAGDDDQSVRIYLYNDLR